VIEADEKTVTIPLKNMLDVKQIYDIFYSLTGVRCEVSISAGVARVNCNTPQLRKDDANDRSLYS